jgi:protoporphyrinogen oxidase
MPEPLYTILGAGLSGISTSYHLSHENCIVFEAKPHTGGHIHSQKINGFTWDEGPHVSFTKHQYVKDLFAESVENDFLEFPVHPTNYYKGAWIPHPAQSNLWAVPEPLRTECLNDFLATRKNDEDAVEAADYEEWLLAAFGSTFTKNFPETYTKKYWTVPSKELTTDWVGGRIFYPDIDVVKNGYEGPQEESTHYISSIRYPANGGYHQYASGMEKGMQVECNKEVAKIDLERKEIHFTDGSTHVYQTLISTLPLPKFIGYCKAPEEVQEAAATLSCSELLILNFEVAHPPTRTEQWIYVYDEDFYSTRINFTDLLSPNNAPTGKCGIQVEVYFSKYKPLDKSIEYIKVEVSGELVKMGLIKDSEAIAAVHTQWIPFANVIFDHPFQASINTILDWLTIYGLKRESDDSFPMTDWEKKFTANDTVGNLVLAGRFGQWKYYWTDDCVLRGKYISEAINSKKQ